MNGKMWMHPADGFKRRNPQTTRRQFHRTGKGQLVCGYEGIGRLWPVDEIVAKALEYKKR
jgi:phosphopantothenoylcysteine decarboxylase